MWWHVSERAFPTNVAPGSEPIIQLLARNVGDATGMPPASVREQLPAGVKVEKMVFYSTAFIYHDVKLDLGPEGPLKELELCKVEAHAVECTYPGVETLERTFEKKGLTKAQAKAKAEAYAKAYFGVFI